MAGAMRLGELVHLMESRLLLGDSLVKATPDLFEALDTDLDHIAFVLDRLQKGEVNAALPWLATEPAPVAAERVTPAPTAAPPSSAPLTVVAPAPSQPVEVEAPIAATASTEAESAQRAA